MEMRQKHFGSGDNIGRDKIVNIFVSFSSILGIKFYKYLDEGLKKHSLSILGVLNTKISLDRDNDYSVLLNSNSKLFLVKGQAGTGKSFYIKSFLEDNNNLNSFVFRGSEFNILNINKLFNNYGGFTFLDFEKIVKKKKKQVYIIIDSAEQLLDIKDTNALYEFLSGILSLDVKIIFTCREQYIDNINTLLGTLNYGFSIENIININLLTEYEVLKVLEINNLNRPEDINLFELLQIPFYLNIYIEFSVNSNISYTDFREKVLDYKLGSNFEVRNTFETLVLERVHNLNYYLKGEGLKIDNLNFLIEKGVIAIDKDRGYFITYDIYEEWSLIKYINKKYIEEGCIKSFFKVLGRELPMRRAFKIWMKDKLLLSKEGVKDLFEKSINDSEVEDFWKDEIIISILSSKYGKEFLIFWKTELLKDENVLLNRVLLLTLITGKVTNKEILLQLSTKKEYSKNATMFLKAEGIIWDNIIDFIYSNKEDINLNRNLLNIIKEYTFTNKEGNTAKKYGLVAIFYLTNIENNRIEHGLSVGRHNEPVEILSKSILAVSGEIKEELEKLLDTYLNFELKIEDREKKSLYFGEPPIKCDKLDMKPYFNLVKILLSSTLDVIQPASHISTKILEVFDYSLYCEDLKGEQGGGLDIGGYFGISERYDFNYFPASAYQTPFYWLFKNNKDEVINFIINFNNKVTKKYIDSSLSNNKEEIVLYIDDKEYKQYADTRLYGLYRGFIPVPGSLSSMHMGLEKYLLEFGKNASKEKLTEICKKLLLESISISTTAIVVSISLAYPDKLQEILLILLKTKDIFLYDLNRYTYDMSVHLQYGIGKGLDFNNDIHYNERLDTCKEEHRKITFEHAIRLLQLNCEDIKINKEINIIFDKYFEEYGNDEEYKFILNRTDLRKVDIKIKNTKENQTVMSFNSKDEKIIKDSEASLEKVNKSSKYLGLSNYSNNKLSNINFNSEKYSNFSDVIKELKLFLEDYDLKERTTLYRRLPINIAYVGIRDYYKILKKEDNILFKDIILEYGNNILSDSIDRNFTPQIGDEIIFYGLVLLFQKNKEDKDIKKLILEIIINSNYYYISQNIFANKLNFLPLNIFSIIEKTDKSFFESILWGFIFVRNKRKLKENIKEKINGEYAFNLSTKKLLEDYDKYIDDLLEGNNEEYKNYILDNFDDIEDYLLIYGFKMFENGNINNLDYVNKLSNRVFLSSFTRDDRIEYTTLQMFLDKYVNYILLLESKNDIDFIIEPLINNITLKTDTPSHILSSFLSQQDYLGIKTYNNFWYIWNDKFLNKFIGLLKEKEFYFYQKEFIANYLFARQYWKNTARDWHTLKEDNNIFFSEVIREIGTNKFVLYSIVKLIDGIGTRAFFNYGIDWVSDILLMSEEDILSSFEDDDSIYKSNLIYHLENYLRSYLFINNQQVRYDQKLKEKVLLILDVMVKHGSSTAYLLRDNI